MSSLLRLLFISITTTITIHSKIVDSQPSIPPPSDGGVGQFVPSELWCVAKNNADDAVLQSAMDWACGQGGADYRPIQSGGPCYEPNNLQAHASFAFNDYFLKNGPSSQSCDFGGAAALTSLNPKVCLFASFYFIDITQMPLQ
ncbi:Glucan endo-1,3-beta-glucosidase-like protein 1 [Acorus gramineus]|uniref:Glucan endo-1,3-beta-glucosidase-like protein 1 n=1 Tax=Acorus gramineus TaxID=55184 RepID=A0AAV9AXF8_ACOGR|nr:Glucan endo-1,3-beta-glucosidase-like protein 1 [Acorus gramineus]